MKTVEAKLLSLAGKKRSKYPSTKAMVRVLIGEGQNRRSVTRHVKNGGGGVWIGRNPDDSVNARHATASRKIFEAQTAVNEVVTVLTKLQEFAGGKIKESQDDFFAKLLKHGVAAAIASEETNLSLAEEDIKRAEKYQEDVEREYPLYVQFNF